jgi:chromosome segregation ATPase
MEVEFETLKTELKELRESERQAQVEAALLRGQIEQMKERLKEKDKEIMWLRDKIN